MTSFPDPVKMGARLLFGGTGAFLCVFSILFIHHLLLTSTWFSVETIVVAGGKRLTAQEAVALGGLRPGGNIFSADIRTAARRIASHPWVQEVRVRRKFPGAIEIVMAEWEPAALLSIGSRMMYVDADGRVFNGLGRVGGLPRITATRGGEKLLDKGVEALTSAREGFPEVLLDGMEGVTLVRGDGRTVHLGSGGFGIKNMRVERIMRFLKARDIEYEVIDVGFSERAFVRILRAPANGTRVPGWAPLLRSSARGVEHCNGKWGAGEGG